MQMDDESPLYPFLCIAYATGIGLSSVNIPEFFWDDSNEALLQKLYMHVGFGRLETKDNFIYPELDELTGKM